MKKNSGRREVMESKDGGVIHAAAMLYPMEQEGGNYIHPDPLASNHKEHGNLQKCLTYKNLQQKYFSFFWQKHFAVL